MSPVPDHWIPHTRDDGEVVGWIDMDSSAPALIPVDRLGRHLAQVADWPDAEAALEERGLKFLTNKFRYRGRLVRIRSIYDDRIVVTTAVSDAIGDVGDELCLPFPAEVDLVEHSVGDNHG